MRPPHRLIVKGVLDAGDILGNLEELFVLLLEKPREQIVLSKYGFIADEPATPIEIPP